MRTYKPSIANALGLLVALGASPALAQTQPSPNTPDQAPSTTGPGDIAPSAPPVEAAAPIAEPPVAPPAPATPATNVAGSSSELTLELSTLEQLHQRGILSDAAFDSAVHDLSENMGAQAGDAHTLVLGRWATTFYGFVEGDTIVDSTQSFNEGAGNGQVQRGTGLAANNARTMFSVRNSRIGFRLAAPQVGSIRTSAQLEMDFLGNQPASNPGTAISENAFFTNPTFRVRHFNLKIETPVIDVLIGQYWQLFGWQSTFHPNTVEIQGVPGQIYSRAPQIRLSHTFKSDVVTFEIAAAAMRPPQRDSAMPEGEAGLRLAFNHWQGIATAGSTGTALQPASIAVSGDIRSFSPTEFSATPTKYNSVMGWGFAADLLLPIIPATSTHSGNALTLTGEFAISEGLSDMYTGLNGGVSDAALPNPMMMMPAPTYTRNIADNGQVVYTADGVAHVVQWMSTIVGLQYYLPGCDGRLWLSSNFSHLASNNSNGFGAAAKVRKSLDWFDVNVFGDITPAVRLGLEYAAFLDHYQDGTTATNHRVQFSGFYRF